MPGGQPNRQTRRPRPKAYLACDTCRRRKSRCDGLRPACSHCVDSGAPCNYRSLPTNFESDASVLSRLARAEARIEALEKQAPVPLPEVQHLNPPPVPVEEVGGVAGSLLPEFHHGANHKILQYWSRLRVQMTVPDIHVLSYIKDAEAADMLGSSSGHGHYSGALFQVSLARQALQTLNTQLHRLPIALSVILTQCRLYQDTQHSINLELARRTSAHEHPTLCISDLPTDELILYSIAFKLLSHGAGSAASYASEAASACFLRVLDRLWEILMLDDEEALTFLFTLTVLHLDFFHQPFHALGVLKIMDPILERLLGNANKHRKNPLPFHELYYMLQSDILSEVDGIPMRCTPMVHPHGDTNLDSGAMAHISQSTATPGQHNPPMEQDETNQRITIHSDEYYYFSRNVWLRARLNRIISEMYTTDQAYCKPENVASIVTEISLELECWYRSLPVDLHFTRDVKSFQIRQPRMSTRLKEISLRYHSCLLALNRPVLYWVLYEDLENSNPTPSSSSASGIVYAEQQPESWLFPSCRKCIESAKMIILTLLSWARQCEGEEGEGMVSLTWCETQLLVGSFAVLLSVQTATSFSYAFPDAIDIGHLLDTVEELLSTFGTLSLADRQTLEILLNMKRNFEVSSPVALMT